MLFVMLMKILFHFIETFTSKDGMIKLLAHQVVLVKIGNIDCCE